MDTLGCYMGAPVSKLKRSDVEVDAHIPLGIRLTQRSIAMKSFRRHLFERANKQNSRARFVGHDMPSPTMTSFRLICAAGEVSVSDKGTTEWQGSARETGRPLVSRAAPRRRRGRWPLCDELVYRFPWMSVQLNSPAEFGSVYSSKSGEQHSVTSLRRRQDKNNSRHQGSSPSCSSAERM